MTGKPSLESLLAANRKFYKVFENQDMVAMGELWEDSDRVYCVHPGWPPIRGLRPVLDSWRSIMSNTEEIYFELAHEKGWVEGLIGGVVLQERIQNKVDQERQTSVAVATNLFSFDPIAGVWQIFHHHASHSPMEEEALGGLLV